MDRATFMRRFQIRVLLFDDGLSKDDMHTHTHNYVMLISKWIIYNAYMYLVTDLKRRQQPFTLKGRVYTDTSNALAVSGEREKNKQTKTNQVFLS